MSRSIREIVGNSTLARRLASTLAATAVAAVAVAGCGGSSSHSVSGAYSTSPTSGSTRPKGTINPGGPNRPVTTSTGTFTASVTGTSTAPTASTPTSTAPASSTQTQAQANPSNGGATNARVPATYTIGAGGKLTPPTVTVPAYIAVQLTFSSSNGQTHTVVVHTPAPHTLKVPATGTASVKIPGQKNGTYPVDVDGVRKGTLTIGGDAGP